MKRVILVVGGLLGLGGLIFWYSKTLGSTTLDDTTSKSGTTSNNGTPNSGTPNSGTHDVPVVVPPKVEPTKYSEKIGLTYEGQAIYKKWNGVAVSGSLIGYLIDGTLLSPNNAIYENGEYKRKTPINIDVNLSLLVGMLNVDGTIQKVFQQKTGVNLSDYLRAVGFLENGLIVYLEVRNEGETSEYSYYRT